MLEQCHLEHRKVLISYKKNIRWTAFCRDSDKSFSWPDEVLKGCTLRFGCGDSRASERWRADFEWRSFHEIEMARWWVEL